MFKAWNKETKLLMRLSSIECVRGELFKKNHILLQFTGLYDKQDDEVYEMDVMLIGSLKYLVVWDNDRTGWSLQLLNNRAVSEPFNQKNCGSAVRLCNFFEMNA